MLERQVLSTAAEDKERSASRIKLGRGLIHLAFLGHRHCANCSRRKLDLLDSPELLRLVEIGSR